MQHGCKLNSQFARRMDGHAKLKCFANSRRLHAWTNAAPESCVQQDHIDGSIQNVSYELLDGSDLAASILRIRIAKEEIRGEGHPITQAAAKNFRNRQAPLLAQKVETGELDRGENLSAIVIERRRRIRNQETHFFEP